MMRADEVNGHAVKSYVGRHVLRVKLLANCSRMVDLKDSIPSEKRNKPKIFGA